MLKNFSKRLAVWIPEHVSAKLVVVIYRVLELFCMCSKTVRIRHLRENTEVLKREDSPLGKGYIENQTQWSEVKFGKTDMAFAGCEIMAVYNVLLATGHSMDSEKMAELINHFEHHGAALQGRIGTSPMAMVKYLNKQGIKTRVVWKEEKLDSSAKATIVTMYNNYLDLYDQIHTVAYNQDGEGVVSHNAGSDNKIYADIREAIHGAGEFVKMICAIEIRA